jgi:hypothetical protein
MILLSKNLWLTSNVHPGLPVLRVHSRLVMEICYLELDRRLSRRITRTSSS